MNMRQTIEKVDDNKQKMLEYFSQGVANSDTQSFFYTYGNQETENNGAAKYVSTLQDTLYEKEYYQPLQDIKEQINLKEKLCCKSEIHELGPGSWGVTPYLSTGNTNYKVFDHSSYMINKVRDLNEGVVGVLQDWMKSDSIGPDRERDTAIVMENIINNLSDEEIAIIMKKVSAKRKNDGMYFTYFEHPENEEDIQRITAAYGDYSPDNPYRDRETHQKSRQRMLGGFVELGFNESDIDFVVEYCKSKNAIYEGFQTNKDVLVHYGDKTYKWQKGEKILPAFSRTFNSEDIDSFIENNNRSIKETVKIGDKVGVWCEGTKNREKSRSRKIVEDILFSLALVTSATGITGSINQYKKFTELNKQKDEVVEKLHATLTGGPYETLKTGIGKRVGDIVGYMKTIYNIPDGNDQMLVNIVQAYLMSHPDQKIEFLDDRSINGHVSPRITSRYDYLLQNMEKDDMLHYQLMQISEDVDAYKKYDTYHQQMKNTINYYDNELFAPNEEYSFDIKDIEIDSKDAVYLGEGYNDSGNKLYIYEHGGMILASFDRGGNPKVIQGKGFIDHYLQHRYKTRDIAYQASTRLRKCFDYDNDSQGVFAHLGDRIGMIEIENILKDGVFEGIDYKDVLGDDQKIDQLIDGLRSNGELVEQLKKSGIDIVNYKIAENYGNIVKSMMDGHKIPEPYWGDV